jgi:hypothetical protein
MILVSLTLVLDKPTDLLLTRTDVKDTLMLKKYFKWAKGTLFGPFNLELIYRKARVNAIND